MMRLLIALALALVSVDGIMLTPSCTVASAARRAPTDVHMFMGGKSSTPKAARKAARRADEEKRAQARAADKAAREADEAARKAQESGQGNGTAAGVELATAPGASASSMASAFAFGFLASSAAVLATYGSRGRRSGVKQPLLDQATVV